MLNLPSPTSPTLETQWPCPLPNPASSVTTRPLPTSPPTTNSVPTPKPTRQATTPEPSAPPFRNVSACNRCRLRKHRCDQRLPRCESCEKAQVRCVGYDPLTKQEVPRSYVAFLESRVNYLSEVLLDHGIDFKPAIAYDEEETLRTEAERSAGSTGLRHSPRATRPSLARQGADMSRKRKLSQLAEERIPPRQFKRLSQLNVLLKELFNDDCSNQCIESREQKIRQSYSHPAPSQRELPMPRGHRSSWSPQSFQSIDHSDGRTSPETASPSSSHDQYPYSYHDPTPRRGMSLFGAASILDSDNASRVYESKHPEVPEVDLDLVGFQFNGSDTKTYGAGCLENSIGRTLNIPSYRLPQKAQASPPPEPKFDIAADLLRGRKERVERVDKDRVNLDFLDEFLVDWAE